MRQHKYRAWDPIKKEMHYNQFCITAYGYIQKSEISREWHSWRNEDWILMQFTGLLDKNGNEIYEGDILRCDWGDGFVSARVFWNSFNGVWMVQFNGNGDTEWLYEVADISKIIGNIHENPELLGLT